MEAKPKIRLTVDMDVELNELLRKVAKERNMSMNGLIRKILWQELG